MKMLVTGGAGFIGRWVVNQLLSDHHKVWIVDDLSNGRIENIQEFIGNENFIEFVHGDIKDTTLLNELFQQKFDLCYHLAASINVHDSIEYPAITFNNDTIGTFYILEQCKKHSVKLVFMSTCMVYERSSSDEGINEAHPIKPTSPYAGAKIAAENMVLSYYYAFGLPTVVVRPFNTYGPYQKTNGEGGVVTKFLQNKLNGQSLHIYGEGNQTRDFLYADDCAQFVVEAGYSTQVNGEIVNAGFGHDISINELAKMIVDSDYSMIQHVPHIHPQSEIEKLLCNYDKATQLLGWEPKVSLEKGIRRTEEWVKSRLS
ncbi:dTDP-glucose 4,6-dehydratase [Cytobacillus sp. Hm23]